MKIASAKSISAPLSEGREIVSVNNRRVPQRQGCQDRAHDALPALELGQELEAAIVEELEGGRLLLKLGATLVEADCPGGLGAGQHVLLRVEQLQPHVVLHIAAVEPTIEAEAARLLRAHLPAHADSGELLDGLQNELDAFIDRESNGAAAVNLAKLREFIATLLAGGTPPTCEKLEILARNGGLLYESKLFDAAISDGDQLPHIVDHDLKGLLLSALQESKARAFSEGLQTALGAQLENIETQQVVNLLAQLDGGALQMQIPFFTGSGLSTAALAVERDGREQGDKQPQGRGGYSLLFLLDLENFGRTRVDAHIDATKIRAVFYVEQAAALRLLRRELTSFRETLLALGYRDALLVAKPLGEMSHNRLEKFTALAAGAPESMHLLDTKV